MRNTGAGRHFSTSRQSSLSPKCSCTSGSVLGTCTTSTAILSTTSWGQSFKNASPGDSGGRRDLPKLIRDIQSQESTRGISRSDLPFSLFPPQTLRESWATLGGPPGSGPQALLQCQGQLGHQERGRGRPNAALAGEASGGSRCPPRAPRPILTLVNTILHRARGEGGGALTRGAEAAAPHLDEAISGDRWLRCELRPLGTPK